MQILTGLRPGELLQLRREHVLLPTSKVSRFLFRLGAKRGTKLKREQATWLDKDRDVAVSTILHRWLEATSSGTLLVDCSYDDYRRQLQSVSKQLGLPFVFTPHSPRAGFASEAISLGEDPNSVRLRGRWQSETSFRIYVDVISAAIMVDVLDSLCKFRPMLAESDAHLLDFFGSEVFSHGNTWQACLATASQCRRDSGVESGAHDIKADGKIRKRFVLYKAKAKAKKLV